ncbi:unnamed protein product, partial [Closterium sp. Yama58-4]
MDSPKSSPASRCPNIRCYSGQADINSSGIFSSSSGSVTGTGTGGRTGSAAYNGSAASSPAGNASSDGLEGLNEEQRAAVVASPDGCVRVVAGPGSGKTRVLTHRVVNLIKNLGVHPRKILCITFTNRAANELVTRLQVLLSPEAAAAVHVGTFHGIAARILRHEMLPSLRNRRCYRDYTIYDEDDSLRVIKEIDKQEKERLAKISPYQPGKSSSAAAAAGGAAGANTDGLYEAMSHLSLQSGNATSAAQAAVAEVLGDAGGGGVGGDGVDGDKEGNRLKNIRDAVLRYKEGGMKEDMRGRVGERRRGRFEGELSIGGSIPRYAKLYEDELRRSNALDFDDLTHFLLDLFHSQPHVLQKYQERFQHVLVDEFQDTDSFQYEIVRLLTLNSKRLFVVGDIDQCIYSWRGAEYHYLQRLLDEDFDHVTTLQLRSNYRSSQSILQAANRVIQGGPRDRRVGGGTLELKPTKPPGHPVFFSFFPSCASEAATIAEEIESLVDPAELSPWRGQAGARGVGGVGGGEGRGQGEEDGLGVARSYKVYPSGDSVVFPSIGLGAKSWAAVQQWAQGLDSPAGTAILELALGKHTDNPPPVSKKARENLLSFAHLILSFRRAVGTVDDADSSLGSSNPSDSSQSANTGGTKELPHAGGLLGTIVDVLGLKQEYSPAAAAAAAAKSRSPNPAALRQRYEEEGKRALDQMERLQDLANRFGPSCGVGMEGVRNFLEQIALLSGEIHESGGKEAQLSANAVRLMTIHKAKGLEFPVVFLTGLENRILPLIQPRGREEERPGWERVTIGKGNKHSHHHKQQQHHHHSHQQQQVMRRGDTRVQSGGAEKDIMFDEEERRLCYVAMTRAQDRLYLSGAQQRKLYRETLQSLEPSVFLNALNQGETQRMAGVTDAETGNRSREAAEMGSKREKASKKKEERKLKKAALNGGSDEAVASVATAEAGKQSQSPEKGDMEEGNREKGDLKKGSKLEKGAKLEKESNRKECAEAAAAEEQSKRKKGSKRERESKGGKGSQRKKALSSGGNADEAATDGQDSAAGAKEAAVEAEGRGEGSKRGKKGSKRKRSARGDVDASSGGDEALTGVEAAAEAEQSLGKEKRKKTKRKGAVCDGSASEAAGGATVAAEAEQSPKKTKKKKKKQKLAVHEEANEAANEAAAGDKTAAEAEESRVKRKKNKSKLKGAVDNGVVSEAVTGAGVSAEALQAHGTKEEKKSKRKRTDDGAASEAAACDSAAAEADQSRVGKKKKKKPKRERVASDGGKEEETGAEFAEEIAQEHDASLAGGTEVAAAEEGYQVKGGKGESKQEKGSNREKTKRKRGENGNEETSSIGNGAAATEGAGIAAAGEQPRVSGSKREKNAERKRALGSNSDENGSWSGGVAAKRVGVAVAEEEQPLVKGLKRRRFSVLSERIGSLKTSSDAFQGLYKGADILLLRYLFPKPEDISLETLIPVKERDSIPRPSSIAELESSTDAKTSASRRTPVPMFNSIFSALLYCFVGLAMGFINKAVLMQWPYSNSLLMLQMAASVVIVYTLGCIGLIEVRPFDWGSARSLSGVVFFYNANVAFALAAVEALSIPVYHVLKRLTPVMVLCAKYLIGDGSPPLEVCMSVLAVVS